MKVFYNSKFADLILAKGYIAITLFGMVFTTKSELSERTLVHEGVHCSQQQDCIGLGLALALATFFICAGLNAVGSWMWSLLALPVALFYIIYGAEWLFWLFVKGNTHDAYRSISFERQARWIAETTYLPCSQRRHYKSLSWWSKFKD